MKLCLVSIVIGVMTWATGPGELTVLVGDEFAVRAAVDPEVTQLGEDGEVIGSQVPAPPYVYEYKYARELIAYTRASEGVTATFTAIEGTPYGKLRVETNSAESLVYFRALKVTAPVKLPTQNASANGVALSIANDDTLVVNPRTATLRISIEAIQLD